MHLLRGSVVALLLAGLAAPAIADREQPVAAARDDDGDDSRFACAKPDRKSVG